MRMNVLEEEIIAPQLAIGLRTPRPRKERLASERIAEGMPIVDEPITISVLTMRWGSMGDSFKTNPFLVNLEKESNVKVNWQIVSSNDWADNQKPVMLAGGESALPEDLL